MFIDRQSPAMPAISAHKKPVNADWQATVAEYIERVGVTDLDDPNAPKRKTPRTDAQLRELEGVEKAKAEARAQAEHKAALARLANGTAVHRQPNERKAVKAVKKGRPKTKTEMPTAKGQAVLDALKANKVYRVADWDMSVSYLKRIIGNVIELGYKVKSIKMGCKTTEYRLIDDKADDDSDMSRLQEAAHLGGALQGLDYLKLRSEIRAQMPGASDSDINDATWAEYKRVYTDGQ